MSDKTQALAAGEGAAAPAPSNSLFDIDLVTAADEGVWMHLEHPASGEYLYVGAEADKKPIRIKVLGRDGDRFRRHARNVAERMARVESKYRRAADIPDEISKDFDADWAGGLIVDWENVLEQDGTAIAYSAENAKALAKRLPWLRRQIDAFNKVPANFLREPQPK